MRDTPYGWKPQTRVQYLCVVSAELGNKL